VLNQGGRGPLPRQRLALPATVAERIEARYGRRLKMYPHEYSQKKAPQTNTAELLKIIFRAVERRDSALLSCALLV